MPAEKPWSSRPSRTRIGADAPNALEAAITKRPSTNARLLLDGLLDRYFWSTGGQAGVRDAEGFAHSMNLLMCLQPGRLVASLFSAYLGPEFGKVPQPGGRVWQIRQK